MQTLNEGPLSHPKFGGDR